MTTTSKTEAIATKRRKDSWDSDLDDIEGIFDEQSPKSIKAKKDEKEQYLKQYVLLRHQVETSLMNLSILSSVASNKLYEITNMEELSKINATMPGLLYYFTEEPLRSLVSTCKNESVLAVLEGKPPVLEPNKVRS